MKIILSIILIFTFTSVFGQNLRTDSLTNNFIQKLINNKIDTILIYKNGCVGCEELIVLEVHDSLISLGNPQISYVFWKVKGVNFLTKLIDYDLYKYDTISFDINHIWNLYFDNKSKIIKESILPPFYIDKKDTLYMDIDHYSFSYVKVIDPNETIDFEINDFYFSKLINKEFINSNYNRNNNTIRKKLQNQINEVIKYIENNKLIEIVDKRKHI